MRRSSPTSPSALPASSSAPRGRPRLRPADQRRQRDRRGLRRAGARPPPLLAEGTIARRRAGRRLLVAPALFGAVRPTTRSRRKRSSARCWCDPLRRRGRRDPASPTAPITASSPASGRGRRPPDAARPALQGRPGLRQLLRRRRRHRTALRRRQGKSGHGREKGFEALYEFSTTKTVAISHG